MFWPFKMSLNKEKKSSSSKQIRMKKITVFLWAHIFALFCSISWAKSCEVPVRTMNVAGLKIGQHIREFQQHHPASKRKIFLT